MRGSTAQASLTPRNGDASPSASVGPSSAASTPEKLKKETPVNPASPTRDLPFSPSGSRSAFFGNPDVGNPDVGINSAAASIQRNRDIGGPVTPTGTWDCPLPSGI